MADVLKREARSGVAALRASSEGMAGRSAVAEGAATARAMLREASAISDLMMLTC